MTNAEIIAKIRAEIERRIQYHGNLADIAAEKNLHTTMESNELLVRQYGTLLPFLYDLEKSLPAKVADGQVLEDEIKRYYEDMDGDCRYVQTARHFYDLGCRRTAEKYDEIEYNRQRASGSSEIPNDLAIAAESFAFKSLDDVVLYGCTLSGRRACFIAGAKWHADHTPLPEDTVLFNKGVEEGKRLMMEEAVEIGTTEICWEQDGERAFPTFDPPVEDLLMPGIISQKYNDGDKVRVIIIKKED